MLLKRLLVLLGVSFLMGSAAWADDVGYIDCSSHPEAAQVFAKARQTPDIVTTVACGERFTILVYGFIFSRVQTRDGKIGYVFSNLISVDHSGTPAAQPVAAREPVATPPPAATPAVTKPSTTPAPPAVTTSASQTSAQTSATLAQPQPSPATQAAQAEPAAAPVPASQAQPAATQQPAAQPAPAQKAQRAPTQTTVFTTPPPLAVTPAGDAAPAAAPSAPEPATAAVPTTVAQPQPAAAQPSSAPVTPSASAPAASAPVAEPPAAPASVAEPASNAPEAAASAAQPSPAPAYEPQPASAQPAAQPVRNANVRSTWEKPIPGARRAFLIELYAGYSLARFTSGGSSTNLNGALGSFGWNLTRWLQIVGDSSYNVVTLSGTKNVLYGNHFGPRVFYHWRNRWGITPFAEGLAGGSRLDTSVSGTGGYSTSTNCVSYKVGGGVDMRASKRFEVRLFNFDYYRTAFGTNTTQNSYTIAAGVVLRLFEKGTAE